MRVPLRRASRALPSGTPALRRVSATLERYEKLPLEFSGSCPMRHGEVGGCWIFEKIDPCHSGSVVSSMKYSDRITIEPGKRGGKPCIRGMRITVSDVLEYLASGMSEKEILEEFPDLERDDIKAVLAFAADRERKLLVS